MPHAVCTQHVATLVDQDVEGQARLLYVTPNGVRLLSNDRGDLYAARGVNGNLTTKLAEPAAAVASPGSTMEGEQQAAAREKFLQRSDATFLVGQAEVRRVRERRWMHQNSLTSTSSPASTMSTCEGISM